MTSEATAVEGVDIGNGGDAPVWIYNLDVQFDPIFTFNFSVKSEPTVEDPPSG
jgi:hypothetical protein